MLLTLALAICLHAEVFVQVDSLRGAVEVRRAGQDKWSACAKSMKLRNNDMVRAGDNATAIFKWANGQGVFLHANSQILINLAESKEKNIFSQHFTLFTGAAYFLLKAALPQMDNDIKVFTPTAVIATRGTSFQVDLPGKNGSTSVKVFSGTVLVRNIIRNAASFINAGNKTFVEINTDPIVPQTMLDDDIAGLKKWVPGAVVDKELASQIARGHRDQLVITGKTENKIIIVPFENKSPYAGSWNISQQLASLLMGEINKGAEGSKAYLADTVVTNPLEYGNDQDARYVITGTIENFDIVQHARITVRADDYQEFSTAQVKLNLQLIDVKNSRIVVDNIYSGEFTGDNVPINTWQTIGKLGFDKAEKRFWESILGKAVLTCVDQANEDMFRYVKK